MKLNTVIFLLPALLATSFKGGNIFANYSTLNNAATYSNLTPEMVTKCFNGDSKTNIAFTWRLANASWDQALEVVENTLTFEDPSTIKMSLLDGTISVLPSDKKPNGETGVIYRALVENLKENTTYKYRVGEANNYKEGTFKTSGTNESFNFIHLSDPQGKTNIDYIPYKKMLRHVNELKPEILVYTGDFVDNAKKGHDGNAYNQWKEALETPSEYLKDVIIAPVSGNHENGDYQFSSRFFVENQVSDEGKSGNFFSFTYNEAYFLGLNTNDTLNPTSSDNASGLSEAQISFIKEDLEKHKDYKWKFVMMHKGIFDPGEHSSNLQFESGTYHDYDIPKIREQLVPIFDQYKVDIVFQGHDHLYSLTYPTKKEGNGYAKGSYATKEVTYNNATYKVKNVHEGTIYTNISTASGSKNYGVANYDKEMFFFEEEQGMSGQMFATYTLSGNSLYVDTYKYDSSKDEVSIYNRWGLTKDKIEAPQEETKPNPETETPKKDNTLIIVLSVLIPVIALIIGTVGFAIYKKKKGK